MITRVWHGLTPPDKAAEFREYVRETGEKAYLAAQGNLGVFLLSRPREGVSEFFLLSFWESLEDVKKFAGPDYGKALYPFPRDKEFLIELEPEVRHFDILSFQVRRPEKKPALPPSHIGMIL
jgi:heme-degrading monooxygenase HmoA